MKGDYPHFRGVAREADWWLGFIGMLLRPLFWIGGVLFMAAIGVLLVFDSLIKFPYLLITGHGDFGETFGIWIVTIILTLIYLAVWAYIAVHELLPWVVRTRQRNEENQR